MEMKDLTQLLIALGAVVGPILMVGIGMLSITRIAKLDITGKNSDVISRLVTLEKKIDRLQGSH